jgi:hypothetical protein
MYIDDYSVASSVASCPPGGGSASVRCLAFLSWSWARLRGGWTICRARRRYETSVVPASACTRQLGTTPRGTIGFRACGGRAALRAGQRLR